MEKDIICPICKNTMITKEELSKFINRIINKFIKKIKKASYE